MLLLLGETDCTVGSLWYFIEPKPKLGPQEHVGVTCQKILTNLLPFLEILTTSHFFQPLVLQGRLTFLLQKPPVPDPDLLASEQNRGFRILLKSTVVLLVREWGVVIGGDRFLCSFPNFISDLLVSLTCLAN